MLIQLLVVPKVGLLHASSLVKVGLEVGLKLHVVKKNVVCVQKSTRLLTVVALCSFRTCSSYALVPQPYLNHPSTTPQPCQSSPKVHSISNSHLVDFALMKLTPPSLP